MEVSLNFTIGLSHGIQWPWPIAVYLFLAGISGGAMAIALLVNLFKGNYENTPLLKSASMVAFVTIALGMVCLVADLTKPLAFWRILINYNLTSVMSLGVIALIAYIPLTFILMLMAFGPKCCPALSGLIAAFDGVRKPLYWIVLILALTICAYTGFLISALVRFPLMNTAVLPGLFVASGLSAGAAAARLFAVVCFGEKHEGCDMHVLHRAEYPIMAAELFCIFMIAMAMVLGNEGQQLAAAAFTTGTWATLFWCGVIGVGFVLPLIASFGKSAGAFCLGALASICGMMCLRVFILYAGQTFVL